MKTSALAAAAAIALLVPGLAQAQALVNGDFEASSSQTATPPGWTNIGHTDGVIGYAVFGTPAYNGLRYYDIGGYGGATPAIGDGIMQTVATTVGSSYDLTFGYSGENTAGVTTVLDVIIGAQTFHYTIVGDNSGLFKKPFTTTTIGYTATAAATAIKFVIASSTRIGFNDPLIDGVSFSLARGGGAVPEPATWGLMILGLAGIGGLMRRRAVRFATA